MFRHLFQVRDVLLCLMIESVCGNPAQSTCALGPGEEHHTVGGNKSGPVWPWQIYKSSPFNPPEFEITASGKPLAPGLIFISPSDFSPSPALEEAAPLIVTDKGQLVWNGPAAPVNNFRVAKYKGQSVLTYWSGLNTEGANIGHGYGNVTFLDSSYNEILVVCPKFGFNTATTESQPCQADLHESYVTERDTLLVTAYNATPADLSSLNGPKDGWVFDCLFYEIEPQSGEILFQWSALEHVPVSHSKQPLRGTGNATAPFDYFHINSVVNIGDQYLVNARHVWSIYLVSAKGDVEWTLQGETGGDFGTLPADGHFSWQHYARPQKISKTSISISIFNNYNSGVDNGTHPSNGLELQLSQPPDKSKPPKVVKNLSDAKEPIYADSQGSNQYLSNGNILLGFGEIAVLKEFGPDSSGKDVRWTARFGANDLVQSYRGFRDTWHAHPKTSPKLVLEKSENSGCSSGFVSWNGATDVTGWEIWEGDRKERLRSVGKVAYKGFETRFNVRGPYVQAVALIGGKAVAKSNTAYVGKSSNK